MAQYWIYINGRVQGPYKPNHLPEVDGFTPQSLACPDGSEGKDEEWKSAWEFDEIQIVLDKTKTLPPISSTPSKTPPTENPTQSEIKEKPFDTPDPKVSEVKPSEESLSETKDKIQETEKQEADPTKPTPFFDPFESSTTPAPSETEIAETPSQPSIPSSTGENASPFQEGDFPRPPLQKEEEDILSPQASPENLGTSYDTPIEKSIEEKKSFQKKRKLFSPFSVLFYMALAAVLWIGYTKFHQYSIDQVTDKEKKAKESIQKSSSLKLTMQEKMESKKALDVIQKAKSPWVGGKTLEEFYATDSHPGSWTNNPMGRGYWIMYEVRDEKSPAKAAFWVSVNEKVIEADTPQARYFLSGQDKEHVRLTFNDVINLGIPKVSETTKPKKKKPAKSIKKSQTKPKKKPATKKEPSTPQKQKPIGKPLQVKKETPKPKDKPEKISGPKELKTINKTPSEEKPVAIKEEIVPPPIKSEEVSSSPQQEPPPQESPVQTKKDEKPTETPLEEESELSDRDLILKWLPPDQETSPESNETSPEEGEKPKN